MKGSKIPDFCYDLLKRLWFLTHHFLVAVQLFWFALLQNNLERTVFLDFFVHNCHTVGSFILHVASVFDKLHNKTLSHPIPNFSCSPTCLWDVLSAKKCSKLSSLAVLTIFETFKTFILVPISSNKSRFWTNFQSFGRVFFHVGLRTASNSHRLNE